jgi:hypothetical protein
MYRNVPLKDAYIELQKKVTRILIGYIPEYIPDYRLSKYKHQFNSLTFTITHKTVAESLFQNLISEKRDEIEKLVEFERFFQLIKDDHAIAKHLDQRLSIWGGTIFNTRFDYINNSLPEIVMKSYEKHAFDQSLSLKNYSKLENFLYNDGISVQVISPIYNLETYGNKIDLSILVPSNWKLTIRKMTIKEKNSLLLISGYEDLRNSLVLSSKYLLDLSYTEKKRFGEETVKDKVDEVMKILRNIISSLRLIKPGKIGISISYFRPEVGSVRRTALWDFDYMSIVLPSEYSIHKKDVQECKIFMKLLNSSNKHLEIALDRFNLAYSRGDKSDKLIDLMIAYESLFSGEITDSVSHKLALRLSRLSSSDDNDRKRNYRRMKELYLERNKVVHGGKKEVSFNIVHETEEFIRTSLKKYLLTIKDFSNDHGRFLDSLDFN